MDDKQLSNSKKKKRYGFLFRFLIRTVVFILVVILLLTFVFRLFRMTGNTMSPLSGMVISVCFTDWKIFIQTMLFFMKMRMGYCMLDEL